MIYIIIIACYATGLSKHITFIGQVIIHSQKFFISEIKVGNSTNECRNDFENNAWMSENNTNIRNIILNRIMQTVFSQLTIEKLDWCVCACLI